MREKQRIQAEKAAQEAAKVKRQQEEEAAEARKKAEKVCYNFLSVWEVVSMSLFKSV